MVNLSEYVQRRNFHMACIEDSIMHEGFLGKEGGRL